MTEEVGVAPEDTDYIYYCGPIERSGYEELTRQIEKEPAAKNCFVILTTTGGDPDAAYRMGRALGHYYEHVTCFVPDICKSAGTLMAIAAHSLVVADTGELGPLDIQLSKPDEMFERSSGLDLPSALDRLQTLALISFRRFVTDIKVGGGISTKLASEVATNLTAALVEPIVSQIDPVRVGEHNRAMQIVIEYGDRLNDKFRNLRDNAIMRLAGSYPHHAFVIDRKEATEIFHDVRGPNEYERHVLSVLGRVIRAGRWDSKITVLRLPEEMLDPTLAEDRSTEDEEDTTSGGDAGPASDQEQPREGEAEGDGRDNGAKAEPDNGAT